MRSAFWANSRSAKFHASANQRYRSKLVPGILGCAAISRMTERIQRNWRGKFKRLLISSTIVILILMIGCSSIERRLLFYPSHHNSDNGLDRWTHNGEVIGFSRTVESPRNVWLMLHGNAGQAADRTYALPGF